MRSVDLTGQVFGRLKVISQAPSVKWGTGVNAMWNCRCSCGADTVTAGSQLRRGRAQSCGCLQKEIVGYLATKHGHYTKAGRSPEYLAWTSMIQRCTNPKSPSFEHYGGRGIDLCPEWKDFATFYKDMGPRPDGCSLERSDNNLGYFPANCYWATKVAQQNNRRANRVLTYAGRTQTAAQWARGLGLKYVTLIGRLNAGWPVEKALSPTLYK